MMLDHVLEGNTAPCGSAIAFENSTGITLTNTLATGNVGGSEVILSDNGYVDLRYITIAGNGDDDSALLRFDGPVGLSMSNSILHDGSGAGSGLVVDAAAGGTVFSTCAIVHEDTRFTGLPNVVGTGVANPQGDDSGRYPAWL